MNGRQRDELENLKKFLPCINGCEGEVHITYFSEEPGNKFSKIRMSYVVILFGIWSFLSFFRHVILFNDLCIVFYKNPQYNVS